MASTSTRKPLQADDAAVMDNSSQRQQPPPRSLPSLHVLRPLILGLALGGLAVHQFLDQALEARESRSPVPPRDWLTEPLPPGGTNFSHPCRWTYMAIRSNGWYCASVDTLSALNKVINTADHELVIPLFPTVFEPIASEDHYYNTLFESVQQGDKVLVVGCGSGSDSWVASLKSQRPVYAIDINSMAVANTKNTARLAGFEVHAVLGDIRDVALPEDFRDFDFVFWNMPFLFPHEQGQGLMGRYYHDGDDGSILKALLNRLPSLLTEDGEAILLNTPEAAEILGPAWAEGSAGFGSIVYTFSNNASLSSTPHEKRL